MKLSRFPICRLAWAALFALCPGAVRAADPTVKAEHVVIMVWDGLRPDSVADEATPTLARLARAGVTFTRHHPVYPSSTEVNGTAMATGCYPGHSGLIGNREFRPAIDPLHTVATESPATIRKGDALTSGHYLRVPTLPELMHAAGWPTAIAGTKPVALLWDRATTRPDPGSVTLFGGTTLPADAITFLNAANGGPFPLDVHLPNTAEDNWTTRALTGGLWKFGPLKFSVLWLSDPDFTQHQFGPGSPQALRALAGDDANLAAVLAALDAGHWRDKTDVFVVSDHGFATVGHPVDVAARLTAAGFPAVREYKDTPKIGDVLVNGLGGTVFLYVAGRDRDMIQRLTTYLQQTEFAGVIFTRDALPGTFPIAAVHLDSPDAPDLAVSLRWSDAVNAGGLPGEIFSDGGRRVGQGNHATLSRFEMHNTLVAAGPDFRAGFRDDLPTSNADLAPTVAQLLGLPHPPMDGRVLTEALAGAAGPAPTATTERLEATRAAFTASLSARWAQYLQVSHCGGETYFDEGNAAPVISSPTSP